MSRSKRHPTEATTSTTIPNTGDSALNDHILIFDPYPTPSTSPSLAPTRHHHPPPSPLSSYTTPTSSSSTTFTNTSSSTSSSSYHTIAGAAAAHLIKQKQQLQQQQQQAIRDNAHTLPAKVRGSSTTTATAIFNIPAPPRKSSGRSILGQLLAAHSPGGRNNNNGSDNSLSSETHRPKEQQRRSILPASWGLNFSSSSKSKTMQQQHGGPSLTSKLTTSSTAAPTTEVTGTVLPIGGPLLPSQLKENSEPMDRLQPVLPSVWLESILSGLTRADLNTPPHYATLPRVNWQDEQQQQHHRQQSPIFPGLGPQLKRDDKPSSSTSTRLPSLSTVAGAAGATSPLLPSSSTLQPIAQRTLHKKSSVCELALGDDARELFQQNRPKTLSSAVISSSIVPMKESLRNNMRQRSLDSSTTLAPSGATAKPVSLPSLNHRASSGSATTVHTSSTSSSQEPAAPTTVKTTRGRFTIESQSALPSPARTRTLSCTSGIAMNHEESSATNTPTMMLSPSPMPLSGAQQDFQRSGMSPRRMDRTASFSVSPSSPTLSHSFPSSRSLHSQSASSPSFPPSPRLSPLSMDHTYNSNNDNYNRSNSITNTTSSPILIPSRASPSPASSTSGRSLHQRSQSSTSSTSSSRFSQVIIPPPASAASLQFASFSSIGSPTRSSAPSAITGESSWTTGSGNGDSLVTEKRPNNSGGSNNIRNLSIQIVEADRASRNSSRASRRTLEYEGEPTPVHPLDEDLAAASSSSASTTPAVTLSREDSAMLRTHQTMNRVHPNLDQDFVDSPGGSEGSSSLGSRVGSISGGNGGSYMGLPDRRASDNVHQQKQQYEGGFGYFDRTAPGSFRPRSLSATNLDSVGSMNNGSTPSLHQQLSWADRTAMQREGASSSRSFDVGTPKSSSSLSPPGGELNDVVMVKSAKGRMFTVERQSTLPPASPTRSSRFIVVSSTEDMCLSSPLSPHHSLH